MLNEHIDTRDSLFLSVNQVLNRTPLSEGNTTSLLDWNGIWFLDEMDKVEKSKKTKNVCKEIERNPRHPSSP